MKALLAAMLLLLPAHARAWQFPTEPDAMGRGEIKFAIVKSDNVIELGFPYQGPQHGELALRIHPKYGKHVLLRIDRGQFLCGSGGCQTAVRFDEGKVQSFSAAGAADHSTTIIALENFDRFIAQARKARKVRIGAQLYQEGEQIFEFSVADLGDWPGASKKAAAQKSDTKKSAKPGQ